MKAWLLKKLLGERVLVLTAHSAVTGLSMRTSHYGHVSKEEVACVLSFVQAIKIKDSGRLTCSLTNPEALIVKHAV